MRIATYTTSDGVEREIVASPWTSDDGQLALVDFVIGVIGPEADPRVIWRRLRDLGDAKPLADEYIEDCRECVGPAILPWRDVAIEEFATSADTDTVLARYRNRDGDRVVALMVLDD